MKQREYWIDELRGFAILCVVLGHVIQRTSTGLDYTNGIMCFLDVFVNSIHMPIFFIVSGYMYGIVDRNKIQQGYAKEFFVKKSLDLLLPYTYFAVAIWFGKMIFSEYVTKTVSIHDLLTMFISPIAFLWYIYVLFIISILIALLDKFLKGNNVKILIATLLLLAVEAIFSPSNMSVQRTVHYISFFFIGTMIAENKKVLENKKVFLTVSILFGICTIVHSVQEATFLNTITTHYTGGIFFVFLFYHLRKQEKGFLRKLGIQTLYIYILHPIVINLVRAIFRIFSIEKPIIWIIVLMIVGVGIPYIYSILAKKYAIFEVLFKPRKYILDRK